MPHRVAAVAASLSAPPPPPAAAPTLTLLTAIICKIRAVAPSYTHSAAWARGVGSWVVRREVSSLDRGWSGGGRGGRGDGGSEG